VVSGKHPSPTALLARLRVDLVEVTFVIVDHWLDDHCAVGIAAASDHQRLVYISNFPPEVDSYSYECELPPEDEDFPYTGTGVVDGVRYEALLDAVRRHLT